MSLSIDVKRVGLPNGFDPKTTPLKWQKGFHVIADESVDTTTISGFAKVIRGIFTILSKVPALPIANGIVTFTGTIADTVKALGTAKSAKDIADQVGAKSSSAEKGLKVTSAVTGVAIGTMTGMRIAETLKLFNISHAFGTVRVMGRAVSLFGPFLSFLEGFKACIDIGISAKKLSDMNKKGKVIAEHINKWSQPITEAIALQHIDKADTKLQSLEGRFHDLSKQVHDTGVEVENAKKAYLVKQASNKAKNCFTRLFTPLCCSKEAKTLRKWAHKHHEAFEKLTAVKKLHDAQLGKINRWNDIHEKIVDGTLTTGDTEALNKMSADKIAKWNVRKINLNLEKLKEGLGVAISAVVIVAMVVSIVFFFLGIAALTATLALTALFLLISAAALSVHLFKRYKKPKPTFSVPTAAVAA